LKALTILAIAGMIFGFYFLERKKVQYRTEVPRKVFLQFGYALTVVVMLGIVLGFIAAGSPATERKRSFDERRAEDLSSLANCVSNYAQQFERLPATLSDLERSSNFSYCTTRDPETNEPYTYRVVSELAQTGAETLEGEVELCAVFVLPSVEDDSSYPYLSGKWYEHGEGESCDVESITVKQLRPAEVPNVLR
jgi:hypothetical protein